MTKPSENSRIKAVATIGVFDGVHLGHRALIGRVVQRATELGAQSACVTFSPHPEDVLRPERQVPFLATLEDRLALIRALGVSDVVLMEFTPSLARFSPEEFLGMLVQRFRLAELWIGADFALGRARAGSPARLAAIGAANGFDVRRFPPVEVAGDVVSSTRIRLLLTDGRVDEARRLLGRPYRLRGEIVVGDRRGRLLGFATANLSVSERLCIPSDGVYAVTCRTGGSDVHPGVANIGVRPTFGSDRRQVEIHLIGYEGDLYGQQLAVDFVARLRGERRFESAAALVEQIQQDVREALELISGRADALLPT